MRAWLLTALSDGCFASVLTVAVFHSTLTRLWQGVASTLLGPRAFEGGGATVAIGVAMHVGVALGWSTVFLVLALTSARLRGAIATARGRFAVAAVYGPAIWLVMSLLVIPALLHRPPSFTARWWAQLVGHIPFVALPIVWSIGRPVRTARNERTP